jgi:hypothetical protein
MEGSESHSHRMTGICVFIDRHSPVLPRVNHNTLLVPETVELREARRKLSARVGPVSELRCDYGPHMMPSPVRQWVAR